MHVGHHPSAVQLSGDGRKLFVADTNDDQIAIVDLTTNGVSYQSVAPFDGAQVGAHPDAFALSPDGTRLFVALAGLNAVEVRDGTTGARLNPAKPTYIPTGWYPSALTVTGSADHYRLWVANAKGGGSAPGYNTSVFLDGSNTNGTVSSIPLLANSNLAAWTTKVFENDALGVTVNPCPVGSSSEVLCPPKGRRSPIKHVVYIVTENKTFDQYFGDINQTTAHPGYDADPSYILYGQPVTPNHHKLADLFSLGDNFFSDAEVSVTGHSWTSGAIATDHNEKTWQADYDQGIRGTHGGGDPLRPSVGKAADGLIGLADAELQDPEGGYIFEDFKNHGAVSPDKARPGKLSMGIYGEHTARASDGMAPYKAPGWKDGDIQYFDTCRAWEFIKGQAPDGPVPNGSSTADDSNDQYQDCEARALPPQFNLAYWLAEAKAGHGDKMPSFIYMSLPVNHTLGTNVGNPTPASMVADNDYAIGLIVDALSHSPFWGSTVVMQTEDDTQAAGDHVSPLRDYLELSSPWASKGPEHQRGSMPALLRTIEQIFGLPPVTLNDRLAAPMHAAFMATTASPDLTPYTAVTPLVPFAVNQPGAVGQAESASMNFSTVDLINEDLLNAILYADARHTTLQIPPKFKR